MTPRATVVIPTYNRADLLPAAIESALAQDEPGIELVVVDDASDDGTPDVVRGYSDHRLRYVRQPENRGLVGNFQTGFLAARSDRVLFLHDDDTLGESACRVLGAALDEHPSAALAFSDHWIVDERGVLLPEMSDDVARFHGRAELRTGPIPTPARRALIERCIPLGSTLFNKGVVAVAWFDEGAGASLDLWLVYRAVLSGQQLVYCDERLMYYRRHAAGTPSRAAKDMAESMLHLDQVMLSDRSLAPLTDDLRRRWVQTYAWLIRHRLDEHGPLVAWKYARRLRSARAHRCVPQAPAPLLAVLAALRTTARVAASNAIRRSVQWLSWRWPPSADAQPRVVLVEPHSGGHFDRTVQEAVDAFCQINVTVAPATAESPAPIIGAVLVLVAFSGRSLAALMRRAGLVAMAGRARAVSALAREAHRELPVLLGARSAARGIRRDGSAPLIVILSSFVRPIWTKRLILGPSPSIEIVFDPVDISEAHPRSLRASPMAATTHAIAQSAVAHGARGTVRTLAHFPVRHLNPDGALRSGDVDDNLRGLVGRRLNGGQAINLCFGMLHGKKDTVTAIRAAPRLGLDESVLIVGAPGFEGRHLPADCEHIIDSCPQLDVVLRYVSEAERAYLFATASRVLIPQKQGIRSMSGSLVDALSFGHPVIAATGTATGDIVESLRSGRSYETGSPQSLADAIMATPLDGRRPPDYELARFGLLGPADWARALIDIARS